jgi:mannose-6-phosphate isomerase-like protein (cupin superfamily)
MGKVNVWNLENAAAGLDDFWSPAIVAELNGQLVKVVRAQGEFIWHHHEDEDELFYVLDGEMEMHLPDEVLLIQKGEACVIPRGMQHKPVAREEVLLLLFEPKETLNTGNVIGEMTIRTLKRLDTED